MMKFVGMIVAAFVLVSGGIGVTMAWTQAKKVENAQRTPAVILKKHLHTHESRDGDGRTTTAYLPEITYRCDFDGGQVVSSEVYPFAVARGDSGGRAWANSILAQYKVGQTVDAWYNPKDVNQTFLIREISFFPYIFILVAAVIAAVFVTVFLRGKDEHRNRMLATTATMLMCLSGAAVWQHYSSTAGNDTDGIMKPVMIVYFALTIIPFATSLPKSGFSDRLKRGLILAGVMGFVGIWLGLLGGGLIGFVTQICKGVGWLEESFGGPHWVMYTIPLLAVPGFLFGLIAEKSNPVATDDELAEDKDDNWFEKHQQDEFERTL